MVQTPKTNIYLVTTELILTVFVILSEIVYLKQQNYSKFKFLIFNNVICKFYLKRFSLKRVNPP